MVLSLLVLFALIWSFYIGYARGLFLQVFYTVVCLVAMLIAMQHYQQLSQVLSLWVPFSSAAEGASTFYFEPHQLFELDHVFYAGLAFFLIYCFMYVLGRLIGIFLHPFAELLPDRTLSNLIAGGLSVLVTWISIQMFFTIFTSVPLAFVQQRLHSAGLINFMIERTPIISNFLRHLWVVRILG